MAEAAVMTKELEIYIKMRQSPLFFIKTMWHLIPVPDGEKFVKGKHITPQQVEILLAIEKAIKGEASRRISIAS